MRHSRIACIAVVALGVLAVSPVAHAGAAVPRADTGGLQVQVGYTYVPPAEGADTGELTAGAVLSNPTKNVARDVEVTFTPVDTAGKRSEAADTMSVPYLLPGQELPIAPAVSAFDIGTPAKIDAQITRARGSSP